MDECRSVVVARDHFFKKIYADIAYTFVYAIAIETNRIKIYAIR